MTTPFKALRALVGALSDVPPTHRTAAVNLQLEEARAVLAEVERHGEQPPPPSVAASLQRERDGWREEAENLQRRLKFAESDLDAMRKHQARDAWYWQGDGMDHPESMGRDMVVVIHAGDLQALLAAQGEPQAATKDAARLDWIERNVCNVRRLDEWRLRIEWNDGANSVTVGPMGHINWRAAIDAAMQYRFGTAPAEPMPKARKQ